MAQGGKMINKGEIWDNNKKRVIVLETGVINETNVIKGQHLVLYKEVGKNLYCVKATAEFLQEYTKVR